ncbi:hypothetical protein SADUNF_Sadunf11G0033700 [Salix dunnii]|uniref:Uncharacterized protein n=1 Tax=Salix dunnii TaxID=1413687 RepID=A0A835JJG4_9ROSI|nr:hypothetical protein SADUNF_Sadunf11G0033700 [Salix dunnii]
MALDAPRDVKPNQRRLKLAQGYDQQKHHKSATHTRGRGNLRNVPVRGGCRRGKRSESSSLLALDRRIREFGLTSSRDVFDGSLRGLDSLTKLTRLDLLYHQFTSELIICLNE